MNIITKTLTAVKIAKYRKRLKEYEKVVDAVADDIVETADKLYKQNSDGKNREFMILIDYALIEKKGRALSKRKQMPTSFSRAVLDSARKTLNQKGFYLSYRLTDEGRFMIVNR